jgi:hypothetical protein
LIAKAGKKRKRFHTIITNALQKKPSYAELAKTIAEAEAAKETAGVEQKVRQYWFSKNEKDLLPAISERNIAQANVIAQLTKPNRLKLRTARCHLKSEKQRAKREWQRELAEECSNTVFSIFPKKTWELAREIEKGYPGHHKKLMPQQFTNAVSDISTPDTENADAPHAHFQSAFDRSHATVDETVLDEIDPLSIDDETLSNINPPPTNKGVENAIYKMKNGTAAGITGETSDMLKN